MKKITIREFQQNIYKALEGVPLLITKRGVPEFIIERYTKTDGMLRKKKVATSNVATPNVATKIKGFCKHGSSIGLCKYGCIK